MERLVDEYRAALAFRDQRARAQSRIGPRVAEVGR